jgi:hypothetical protein
LRRPAVAGFVTDEGHDLRKEAAMMLGSVAARIMIGLGLALAGVMPAASQDAARVQDVLIPPGESSATVEGSVTGPGTSQHRIVAQAGQEMRVRLASDAEGVYFDLLRPAGSPIHAGARLGREFAGALPEEGTYTVEVRLVPAAARRSESATYTLDVELVGQAPAVPEAAAEEKPAFWRVTGLEGVPALNIRSGPSTRDAVVAEVPEGTLLRDLGCRDVSGERWCEVESPDDPSVSGWVSGRYVTESATPEQADAMVEGTPYHATGAIDCALGGAPTVSCSFGVTRTGPGAATLVITLPDGVTRTLLFGEGSVRSSDGAAVASAREADNTRVTVGADETYLVPDAVVEGD